MLPVPSKPKSGLDWRLHLDSNMHKWSLKNRLCIVSTKELEMTRNHGSFLMSFFMEIVQRRSESECTVTVSPLAMFDVLTRPPNFISVLAAQ